jgi:hypothetical protein
MANSNALVSVLSELRAERAKLVSQVNSLDSALAVLAKLNGNYQAGTRGILSAAARRRISQAQKARWAKVTATQGSRRAMSLSARNKIAAAQRARWAKIKKGR